MFGLKLDTMKRRSGRAAVAGTAVMHLHCTDAGWTARITDPSKDDPPVLREGTLTRPPSQSESHIEAVFRLAGEAFDQRLQASVDSVHILTDDALVYYTDTRAEVFNTASKTAVGVLRNHGAQQLNTQKVAFGFGPFGALAGGAERPSGVAAFIDAKRVGGCLSRLDRLATRVRSFVPVVDVLVRRAATAGADGPYGAVYLGGYETHVVLADPQHGTVTVRVLPVGVHTLVETLASESNIPIAEAWQAAATRDLMADIGLYQDDRAKAGITRSANDRIIGPLLRRLVGDLEETLEFFETQRVGGRPDRLELFGMHDRLRGLTGFLGPALSVPVEPAPVTVFELFCAGAGGGVNMLEHAGADLMIGQVSFAFHESRLIPAAELAAAERAAAAATAAARPANRPKRGGRGAGRGAKPGFLGSLLASIRGGEASAAAPNAEKDRQNFMVFGLLVVLVLALAYQKYAELAERHLSAMDNVSSRTTENMRLHRQAAGSDRLGAGAQRADKVLWTEKFLSIAQNMNDRMWLTDVFLATETRAIGGGNVLSKKLVLEGALLPSTDGHVKEIALYIENLEKDKARFMSDFREIRFQGATMDQAQTDPVIRFGIEAWYDENKRLQTKQPEGTNASPISDMQQKVRDRNESIDKATQPGGPR